MFPNPNNIIYFVLISIIIFLGLIITFENKAYKNTSKKLEFVNAEMTLLQEQSRLQKQKIDEANKQSQLKEKAVQDKLRNLMKTTVSKDCQQSIQWGIKKAYEF